MQLALSSLFPRKLSNKLFSVQCLVPWKYVLRNIGKRNTVHGVAVNDLSRILNDFVLNDGQTATIMKTSEVNNTETAIKCQGRDTCSDGLLVATMRSQGLRRRSWLRCTRVTTCAKRSSMFLSLYSRMPLRRSRCMNNWLRATKYGFVLAASLASLRLLSANAGLRLNAVFRVLMHVDHNHLNLIKRMTRRTTWRSFFKRVFTGVENSLLINSQPMLSSKSSTSWVTTFLRLGQREQDKTAPVLFYYGFYTGMWCREKKTKTVA